MVHKVAGLQGCIIATGGGAVRDERNTDVLKRQGVFIWLSADVETIVERIRNDLGSEERRPSFSHDDIFRETEEVLEKRIPVYSKLADLSVQTAGANIEEVVAGILRFLGMDSIDQEG